MDEDKTGTFGNLQTPRRTRGQVKTVRDSQYEVRYDH